MTPTWTFLQPTIILRYNLMHILNLSLNVRSETRGHYAAGHNITNKSIIPYSLGWGLRWAYSLTDSMSLQTHKSYFIKLSNRSAKYMWSQSVGQTKSELKIMVQVSYRKSTIKTILFESPEILSPKSFVLQSRIKIPNLCANILDNASEETHLWHFPCLLGWGMC